MTEGRWVPGTPGRRGRLAWVDLIRGPILVGTCLILVSALGCEGPEPAEPATMQTSVATAHLEPQEPETPSEPEADTPVIEAMPVMVEAEVEVAPEPPQPEAAPEPARRVRKRRRRRAKRKPAPAPSRAARKPAGRLARSSIMRTINAHLGDVEQCYSRVALKDPSIAGRIVMQWTLGQDGRPTGVALLSDSIRDKSVGRCLKARARNWKFPPPEGGVAVVTYPFNLRVQ